MAYLLPRRHEYATKDLSRRTQYSRSPKRVAFSTSPDTAIWKARAYQVSLDLLGGVNRSRPAVAYDAETGSKGMFIFDLIIEDFDRAQGLIKPF